MDALPNGEGTNWVVGKPKLTQEFYIYNLESTGYATWRKLEKPKTRSPPTHMDFDRAYDSLVNKTELKVEQNQFIRFDSPICA